MGISVQHVHKSFGGVDVLNGIDLTIEQGEFVALLGPSGSGKTTLLRIIAGLESADAGSIVLFGENATATHVRDRRIGFVFQHFALFRHLSVFENVAFGLRIRKKPDRPSEHAIKARVSELLSLVHLDGFADRFPSQLSGGQRQRVALARALATEPRVLLLDEPFGALDSQVRVELRAWLRNLHDELGITTIIVTHDQQEALELADRVVVMNNGGVEQIGTPTELYDRPATPFVLQFLGDVSVLQGQCGREQLEFGDMCLPLPEGVTTRGEVRVGIRSFDLKFWVDEAGSARVTRIHTLGDRVLVAAQLSDGSPLNAQFPRRSSLLSGMQVGSTIKVEVQRAFVFSFPGEPPVVYDRRSPMSPSI
jgi:sulfate transport system ATP-binding protein